MKTSIFALAASLFCAAFVSASPALITESTPVTLEPRCNACDAACPSTHFYYGPKKCCLVKGGPKNPPSPPSGKDCPRTWYWNRDRTCCTPQNKPPTTNPPNPTCGSTTFPWWDFNNHCCSKPPTGTNPPPPQNSPHHKREVAQPKSKHAVRKSAQLKNRTADTVCPYGMMTCPVPGSTTGATECFEDFADLNACGGCPGLTGQDCDAIPNKLNVACEASGSKNTCVVHSCEPGFVPSIDKKSCVAA
ncbi:hypothetical protein FRB90_009768 [Tulasnella sp. 427]|nr:hypothetical protein FRB90_009768 [Tulasnella sp. 427]